MSDQNTSSNPPIAERRIAGVSVRILVLGTLIAVVVATTAGILAALTLEPDSSSTNRATLIPAEPDGAIIGEPTAVSFVTFDGGAGNTGSYVGRPLVLNFFAEWCPPCLAEMPDFETVYQERISEVAFLGLSTMEPVDSGRRVVEATGITYDVGSDADGSAFAFFGGTGMPTTVFIDATGAVVNVHSGVLTVDQLRRAIDDAFG